MCDLQIDEMTWAECREERFFNIDVIEALKQSGIDLKEIIWFICVEIPIEFQENSPSYIVDDKVLLYVPPRINFEKRKLFFQQLCKKVIIICKNAANQTSKSMNIKKLIEAGINEYLREEKATPYKCGCEVFDRKTSERRAENRRKMVWICLMNADKFHGRELVEYILRDVYNDYKYINIDSARKEFLLKKYRKNRIFVGDYVDKYLKGNDLPSAELLIALSAEKYESNESEAKIIFEKIEEKAVLRFDNSYKEDRMFGEEDSRKQLRTLRKLMEISKRDEFYLYVSRDREKADQYYIASLSKREKYADMYIKFSGFLHWCIMIGEREEIKYYHGRYELNLFKENKKYEKDISIISEKRSEIKKELLLDLIEILKKQRHGTAVILSDFRKKNYDESTGREINEVQRLCKFKRGFLLEQEGESIDFRDTLHEELLLSITEIDGALAMDLSGRILAIGIIVDGEVTIPGNSGRGARYNAINNYILQKDVVTDGVYIGIIFSEDGMIDVVSNLL